MRDLSFVQGLKKLKFLALANCRLDANSFHHLENCKELEYLDVLNTGISDEDFVSLRSLKHIKSIKLPSRELFVDQLLPFMAGL